MPDPAVDAAVPREAPPRLSYWHVWTDPNGISHQSRGMVEGFVMQAISSGASPQWIGERSEGVMSLLFTVLPTGWQGDWHENPAPQWIVPLSGRWGVETMDGQRVEMGPGEVSFGADQGTRDHQGRRGHRSWTVGEQPAVLMIIQFSQEVAPPPVPPAGA